MPTTAKMYTSAAGLLAGELLAGTLPKAGQFARTLNRLFDALQAKGPQAGDAVAQARDHLHRLLKDRFGDVESQALTVKILNLLIARGHMNARDTNLLSRPIGLVVDPSNVCQLACPGCVHSAGPELLQLFDWPKATLPESRFAELLRLYGPSAIGVYFCDYGEPLLNLQTPKLIRMAKEHLIATALSTSLSVRKLDADAYVQSGLDVMILSIDGASQPVYERFRRNGNLELVLENAAKLVEAKRKSRKRTPVLSWNFLAFEHNVHEIPAAEKLARQIGVNVFRVVNPFDVTWDDPEIRPAKIPASVKRLDWTSVSNAPENWNPFPESLARESIGEAFERRFERGESRNSSTGHTCHWLYKNMIMDATGRVMPCCGAPGADGKLAFGSVGGATADPFNSDRYLQARAFFSTGATPSLPIQCTNCDWEQTLVNIGGPEIRRYFRAADPWLFNRRSLDLLSSW